MCAGETYLILDRPLRAVLQHLARGLEESLLLDWPVSAIEHDSHGATLYGPSGKHPELIKVLC